MGFVKVLETLLGDPFGTAEIRRLTRENAELAERERRATGYIREKTNQLLTTIGTLPLRHEELDNASLIETDPIGIVCQSFEQILEHLKEMNVELSLAHDEIQGVFDCAGAAILVIDNTMRIQAFNSRAREIFALDGEELRGRKCAELICGDTVPSRECLFNKIMRSRRPEHLDDLECRGRWFNVSGSPLKDRFGDVKQMVLIYNEITEQKRMLEALRDKEGIYQLILDSSAELFQSVAPDGSLIYVNRAWREALGYSEDEIALLSVFDIVHPDSHPHCRELFIRLLQGSRPEQTTLTLVSKDGTPVTLEGSVSCSFRNGRPCATCGIFRLAATGALAEDPPRSIPSFVRNGS
ncbi:PAS domain-containing protein [Geobacter pickeringii]|uniref:PAS domain-containing protein n=1 Tax=Geobacter pickeringii TaxID=345632 RepID=UPI0006894D3A|nr:PAS domain-containing protein [Geobacter pickeringii]